MTETKSRGSETSETYVIGGGNLYGRAKVLESNTGRKADWSKLNKPHVILPLFLVQSNLP